MIELEPSKSWRYDVSVYCWRHAPPFFVNPRGVLVHRVRRIETFCRAGVESHNAVSYHCGNGCTFPIGNEDDFLFDDPPPGRLLCEFCESAAVRRSQISADELVGRHVHRGALVPISTCCQEKRKLCPNKSS